MQDHYLYTDVILPGYVTIETTLKLQNMPTDEGLEYVDTYLGDYVKRLPPKKIPFAPASFVPYKVGLVASFSTSYFLGRSIGYWRTKWVLE